MSGPADVMAVMDDAQRGLGKTLTLALAAVLLAGCGTESREKEHKIELVCYRDGETTLRVSGWKVQQRGWQGPDGAMRERWSIRVDNGYGAAWVGRDVGPGEVCGPVQIMD